MALHLYAVVRSEHPEPDGLAGVGPAEAAVRLVRGDEVAVAVSDLDESVELGDDDAVRHLDVLLALHDHGPVLPLRLGTAVPDEESLREGLLGDAARGLQRELDELEGLVEVHVNVDDDEDAQIRAIAADPEIRALSAQVGADMTERIRVGELIATRLAERRDAALREVLDRLVPLSVRDSDRGEGDAPVMRWAFLIREGDLPRFDAEVESLRAEHAGMLGFEYVGPLPPFDFVAPEPTSGSRWGW